MVWGVLELAESVLQKGVVLRCLAIYSACQARRCERDVLRVESAR